MKKIIFSFFAFLLIAGCTPPKEEIDIAKEEEAIKALIEKEISLFVDRDYIQELEVFKKADDVRVINNPGRNHSQVVGWDSIYAFAKKYAELEGWKDVTNYKVECKDFNIKVYDKVAWAVYYTQDSGEYKGEPFSSKTAKITILEKVDDNWQYVLNSQSTVNPCETEDEDEEGDEENDD